MTTDVERNGHIFTKIAAYLHEKYRLTNCDGAYIRKIFVMTCHDIGITICGRKMTTDMGRKG